MLNYWAIENFLDKIKEPKKECLKVNVFTQQLFVIDHFTQHFLKSFYLVCIL